MNSTLKDIRSSALQLDKKERIELIEVLLESIDDDQTILYEKEWLSVVKERKSNYMAGKSDSISWESIKKQLQENKNQE